ncbi:MAG: MmcQ/YjbR family DNA-binding protein [Bacilli bacterium]|nr:MmcQ/YjbR family DNA-binding protein [Bacilli bacterium]
MFEDEIFKRGTFKFEKLKEYGFVKKDNLWKYETRLIDDLVLYIVIDDKIDCKIIDTAFNEEYTNHKIESQTGNFVGLVREKYINILNDIKNNCFIETPFITEKANKITDLILKKYGIKPIFKWDNYNYGVFENNKKWFAIIMNIDGSKIGLKKGEVEIINLKVKNVNELIKQKGIYEAYHMNKKNWISIVLDDTLSDEIIMKLVDESYGYTFSFKGSLNEWVMPINPSFFDVFTYFDSTDIFYFDKKKSFKKSDILYLYITKPIGAIMYKFIVEDFKDEFMIVKKIKKYDKGDYPLDILKKYGLTNIRGVRHIPIKLSEYLKG